MKNLEGNIGLIERVLNIADKYKISTIFKTVFIILIFSFTIAFVNNPSFIFDRYEKIKEKRHQEQMEVVIKNNVLIQTELENLLYKTGGDRVILLQYHNTKNSLAGLPFLYLTATNESLRAGVTPVSEGYETLKTSLYPFVGFLSKQKYYCGDIEELEKIDKALGYRMRGNDVEHFAMCHIDSDIPLGAIVITYTSKVSIEEHVCKDVEQILRNSALKIGLLIKNNH